VWRVKSISPDRPFFLYVAPGATHSPHHAPQDWIDRFKGQFDMGWDKYREETLERQKRRGVVPPDTKLTVRSPGLPAWDSLNPDQKRLYARMMEVFAAYGAHCDYHMGRIIDAVKQVPGAENTIFIYIAGISRVITARAPKEVSRAPSTKTCSSMASPRSGRTI
jgi:arylsulfatase